METLTLPQWPYAFGHQPGSGALRHTFADFVVFEELSFEPSGDGEHAFLQVKKSGENSDYVARLLARFAGVRQRDIGYAGLKDRLAITTQWFSVWLPGQADPDWASLPSEHIQVLKSVRHARKLKRGVLAANHFTIRIRHWQGDQDQTTAVLEKIRVQGVPNYFGVQRFGRGGENVAKAMAMFNGRKVARELRSIYLSAARAFIFNQILAERVRQQNWATGLAGDAMMFNGSHGYFQTKALDDTIQARLSAMEIHPTGLLYGIGATCVTDEVEQLEQTVIEQYPDLCAGLIQEKLAIARRALRVRVQNLRWEFVSEEALVLNFSLPPGSFATAVLRELIADL